jgi:hypothetical protein
VLLVILAPFFKVAASLTALTGLTVFVLGIVMVYRKGRSKGLADDFDAVPGYARGGGTFVVYQVVYAVRYPRLLACWVVLEFIGLAVMLTGGIIFETVNWVARENARKLAAEKGTTPRVTGDATLDRALAELASTDPLVSRGGADKLAAMRPDDHTDEQGAKVAQRLVKHADADDVFKRRSVVRALGQWGTANEVPALVKALDHPDVFTRLEALRHIGKFRDERALKAVVRCFVDQQTGGDAENALRKMGPMAEPEVLPLLADGNPHYLRRSVINLLRDIGTVQSVPALRAVAAGNDFKRQAEEALAAIAARGNN